MRAGYYRVHFCILQKFVFLWEQLLLETLILLPLRLHEYSHTLQHPCFEIRKKKSHIGKAVSLRHTKHTLK